MGGLGSGRWRSHCRRPIAEESYAWPITLLRPAIAQVRATGTAYVATQRWVRGREVAGAATFTVLGEPDQLVVRLQYIIGDELVDDLIGLTTTPSNLPCNPGRRYRWRCRCGRRVAVLYSPDRHWRCRHCWNITYASCNASDARISRLLRAGSAAIERLDPGLPDPAWDVSELARWLRWATPQLTLQLKARQRIDQRIEGGRRRR